MAISTFKEDELGRRWDKCLADAVIKISGGLVIGAVSSLVLFKRRTWPVVMGTGFGLGLSYGHCERDIASVLSLTSPPPRDGIKLSQTHDPLWEKCVQTSMIKIGLGLIGGAAISSITEVDWPLSFSLLISVLSSVTNCRRMADIIEKTNKPILLSQKQEKISIQGRLFNDNETLLHQIFL